MHTPSRFVERASFCLLMAFCAAVPVFAQGREFEGAEFQRLRDQYFQEIHGYGGGDAAASIYQRAFAAKNAMSFRTIFPSAVGAPWIPIGPSGFFNQDGFFTSSPQTDAGRVDEVLFNPFDPSGLIIGTPQGGVWKTNTLGASWTPMSDAACSNQMNDVSVDPVNPNIMYGSMNAGACFITRSVDGGATWTNITAGGTTYQILVDSVTAGSTTGTTLFAATFGRIYKSINSGATWTTSLTSTNTSATLAWQLMQAPGAPNTIFAAIEDRSDVNKVTAPRSGIWRTTDKGATWTQLSGAAAPNFTLAGRIAITTSRARPRSLWVAAANAKDGSLLGLWRYDDDTGAWATLNATDVYDGNKRGDFGKQANYDLTLAVDPFDANRVYVAGTRAFRSFDGGATFSQMALNIHCDWHRITVDPKNRMRIAAATDGGVFLSLDGGDSWISKNNNLAIAMYYPGVSIHPTNGTIVLGGTQDNGTNISNGTLLWSGVSGGDGGFTAINPINPKIQYTSCQYTSGGACIYRRDLGAASPQIVSGTAGIVVGDRGRFIAPLVIDPSVPTTLYFGTYRLYRSIDEIKTWVPISGDLTRGSGTLTTIAVAPNNSKFIYVGATDGTISLSRDGGTTFSTVSAGLPTRLIQRINVDPADSLHAMAVIGPGSPGSHVFVTSNGGTSWTNVTGNLPDISMNAGVMIPGQTNHMFVGSDIGVFESTDGGASWGTAVGIPNVIVNDVVYNSTNQLLIAATFGRGMFQLSLANPTAVLRGDVDRDATVNAADALLVLQSMVGTALPAPLTPMPHGDANCNGKLETTDALIILRAAVGLTTTGACVGTKQ